MNVDLDASGHNILRWLNRGIPLEGHVYAVGNLQPSATVYNTHNVELVSFNSVNQIQAEARRKHPVMQCALLKHRVEWADATTPVMYLLFAIVKENLYQERRLRGFVVTNDAWWPVCNS